MCDATFHIKLCTCENIDSEDPNSWQIRRKVPMSEIICEGTLVFDMPTEAEIYLEGKLLSDLNLHDVFDFRYQLVQGDIITINFDKQNFAFEYNGTEFVHGPIDHFFSERRTIAKGSVSFTTPKD